MPAVTGLFFINRHISSPLHADHHHVRQDNARVIRFEILESRNGIAAQYDTVFRREDLIQELTQPLVVVDHEYRIACRNLRGICLTAVMFIMFAFRLLCRIAAPKCQRKGRTLALLRGEGHIPAEHQCETLRLQQTETGSRGLGIDRVAGTEEAREEALLFIVRYAYAVVFYRYADRMARLFDENTDPAARRRIFHGIGQQVVKYAVQQRHVCFDIQAVGYVADLQLDAFMLAQWHERRHHIVYHPPQ